MQRFSKKQQFIRKKCLLNVSSILIETSALKYCLTSKLSMNCILFCRFSARF